MRAIAAWVAKQFDDGLTLVGGAIGVLLVLAGCGALFASMSGALVLATLLGAIFLCLLCLLFIAAHYTDPSIRMSEQEKTERWEQSPDFLKRSLLVFVVGMAIGMGVGGAIGQFTSWAAAAVSFLLSAEGIRRERPPLPGVKGHSLSEVDDPVEYKRLWKQQLWVLYSTAVSGMLLALLSLR
jgi:hypothetical protein